MKRYVNCRINSLKKRAVLNSHTASIVSWVGNCYPEVIFVKRSYGRTQCRIVLDSRSLTILGFVGGHGYVSNVRKVIFTCKWNFFLQKCMDVRFFKLHLRWQPQTVFFLRFLEKKMYIKFRLTFIPHQLLWLFFHTIKYSTTQRTVPILKIDSAWCQQCLTIALLFREDHQGRL